LRPEQWNLPTTAGEWRVRDVVAHLLDADMRRLSFHRDGLPPLAGPFAGPADLLAFLNQLNAEWISATRRLSPAMLLELTERFGSEAARFLARLPPHEPAFWPVAWAGADGMENWMDVGRQYTESWHHQQQIRDAVGARQLNESQWLAPLLSLGVRSIPPALGKISRSEGACVSIRITGSAPSQWSVLRAHDQWELFEGEPAAAPAASLCLDAETAARLWFSARRPQTRERSIACQGDRVLCDGVIGARALMV
jgi:uncharacterized protein (TIGR03083 family)